MEQITATASCPSCKLPVLSEFYFCPNCGKQLRSKSVTVSVGKQIGIYLFSFFLAPLGLYFAFKYINQPLMKTKIVGWVVVFLTFFSITVLLYSAWTFFQQYMQVLNSFGLQ